jgi:hypothetical protein
VRLVLVQDGGLSYDDAEDGVTCILLSYHRRTGDYPWQETKPDVLLLRTLCHDYASAYWRKQKRRERLLDGWMPPSPESSRHLEAIAIGELCAVDINDAFPTSARVMQNYGAYIPFNMPSLSDYALRVRVTDNTDGFTDVAAKRMRVHFPLEKVRKYYPDYVGRLARGKQIAYTVTNETSNPISLHFTISNEYTFVWSTQDKYHGDVEVEYKVITLGGSVERSTSESQQLRIGNTVSIDATLPPRHSAFLIAYPQGRREFWIANHYGTTGFIHEDAFRVDVDPEKSGIAPWEITYVVLPVGEYPDLEVNVPDP